MITIAGYKPKKVYIQTLGGFSVFSYNNRHQPYKMRTKKERELVAFLLAAGNTGVTKEQIYNALWSESESDDVKKLIGVYLTQIKKDFATFGVRNPIVNTQKHYSICRDEIECDIDQFEEAVREFGNNQSIEKARTLVSLYKGEYLLGFEALWATAERIEYGSIYEQALDFLRKCSGSVPQSV